MVREHAFREISRAPKMLFPRATFFENYNKRDNKDFIEAGRAETSCEQSTVGLVLPCLSHLGTKRLDKWTRSVLSGHEAS